MAGARLIPHWVGVLLGEKFFDHCILHKSAKKNEKNIFCLNCCVTICPLCLPLHRHHRRLQIRRYVYQDVIRLSDAQKLLNCSLVQTYTTNSAKVIFLNERPLSRPFRGSGNLCIKCDRSLQDPFIFCSLSCKVHHLESAKRGGKELDSTSELIPLLCKTETDVSFLEDEDDPQMTPDSVLDWLRGSENTGATSNGDSGTTNWKPSSILCTATTEFLKQNNKKRSCRYRSSQAASIRKRSCRYRSSQAASIRKRSCRYRSSQAESIRKRSCRYRSSQAESISRRKGVPHRSPLN